MLVKTDGFVVMVDAIKVGDANNGEFFSNIFDGASGGKIDCAVEVTAAVREVAVSFGVCGKELTVVFVCGAGTKALVVIFPGTSNGRECAVTNEDDAAGRVLAAILFLVDSCRSFSDIFGGASCVEVVSFSSIAVFRELIAAFENGRSFWVLVVIFVNDASHRELAVTIELCLSVCTLPVVIAACASDRNITVSFEGCAPESVHFVFSVGDIANEELDLTFEGGATSWGLVSSFVVSAADGKTTVPFIDGANVRKPSVPFVVDVTDREVAIPFEGCTARGELSITSEDFGG